MPRHYRLAMDRNSSTRFLDRRTPPHVLTLVLMASMSAMVMNMFLPSLPSMSEYFQTDYRVMQLSVALFLAVNGVAQLFIGPLADRFGRRPVLLWGFGLYLLATIGCIYSPTAEVFLFFRMGQASIVVAMVLSRAIVRDLYEQDQAASMIGYVTMGMAIVPMLTPAIGGFLDEHFGWRANFWVFFGAGALVMAVIWLDLKETNTATATSFREQARDYPTLFRSPRFWGYSLGAAFSSGAFFAYLGGAPFVGTFEFGLDPATLGLLFGAPAVGYLVGNGLTGRFAKFYGINILILIGAAIAAGGVAISLLLFYLGLGNAMTFFGFMTLVGLGNGLVLPNSTAGLLSVRPQLAGTASGLGGAMMISGGAALSALAGALLKPGSGPFPLLWIMLIVTLLGVAAILLVMRRERRIRLA